MVGATGAGGAAARFAGEPRDSAGAARLTGRATLLARSAAGASGVEPGGATHRLARACDARYSAGPGAARLARLAGDGRAAAAPAGSAPTGYAPRISAPGLRRQTRRVDRAAHPDEHDDEYG